MIDIALSALVSVWLFILLIPFPLALLSVIAEKVWLRGDTEVNMAYYFQRFLFKHLNDLCYKNNPDKENHWENFVKSEGKNYTVCVSWITYSLLFCGIFTAIAVIVLQNNILTESLILVASVLGFLFIPRFIIDVCKTLKYKPKTGESETIEKLKEDVRLLKQQVDNKQD